MDERYQVGDVLYNVDVIDALPAGSRVIRTVSGVYYDRDEHGLWIDGPEGEGEGELSAGEVVGLRLARVGGPCEFIRPITYERYVWNWRNLTRLGSMRNAGTGRAAIEEMIRAYRIDNTDGNFPAGTGMRIADPLVRDTLPLGSTVYTGDPSVPGSYGLFRRYEDGWRPLLGRGHLTSAYDTMQVTVLSVGNREVEQPWLTREADETDLRRILKFKALVWERAKLEGHHNRWCEWIDTIMRWSDIPGLGIEGTERARGDD